MKKQNTKYAAIIVILVSFSLLPATVEANGSGPAKESPKKAEKKAGQPLFTFKEPIESRPFFTFVGRELLIGFEETYMVERNFQHSDFSEGDIQFESIQHLATLSYELIEGQTIKGKIGSARIKNKAWGYGWHDYELAWGFGGEWDVVKNLNRYFPKIRAALPYGLNMKIGGEYFTIDSDKETSSGGGSLEEEWREWDVSFTFSKNWGVFTPYIGTRISWAEVKTKLDQNISGVKKFDQALKSDDRVGGFIGIDCDFSKCAKLVKFPFIRDLSAHAEIRAFDEYAFTGGLNYTFRF